MPQGLGLQQAVMNFLNVQNMKKDRKKQELDDQIAEAWRQKRYDLDVADRNYLREKEHYEQFDKPIEQVDPNTGEIVTMQRPQKNFMGQTVRQGGVTKQPFLSPKPEVSPKPTEQWSEPFESDDVTYQRNLTTGKLTVLNRKAGMRGAGGGGGDSTGKPPQGYTRGQALDDARTAMGAGKLSEAEEFANILAITNDKWKPGSPMPYKAKEVTLQELQPKAESLYNMQNYGAWAGPGLGNQGGEGQEAGTSEIDDFKAQGGTLEDLQDPDTAAQLKAAGWDVDSLLRDWNAGL